MKKINSKFHQFLFLQFIITALFQLKTFAVETQTSTNVGIRTGALDSILHASFIVQIIILILLSLSIMCWGIAWTKHQEMKALKFYNKKFDDLFWKAVSFDELNEKVEQNLRSSHARVFKAAYQEMKKIAESPLLNKNTNQSNDAPSLAGLDNIERALRKASENETSFLETRLTLLASTGSTGPFIGLFGTVWGIMGSFQKIGQTGSASLAAVAPGISEALITTAIGLAAAIPAVIIYNHFISEIKKEEIQINNFCSDFLNIVKRNFFKG